MPKELQKTITIDLPIHVRRKQNGVYEARFRKKGYNLSVSSKHLCKLKDKFIDALLSASKKIVSERIVPTPIEPEEDDLFETVAEKWLDLRRPTIKTRTAEFYEGLFRATLFPAFEGRSVKTIKQSDVQALINRYVEDKPRTAVKAYQTLKSIFEFAVGEDILDRSPMRLLRTPKYEEKNGVALTVSEESELVKRIADAKCFPEVKDSLLFLLYTGIRRSELASAVIEDGFVSVVCGKIRKGYRERRRLIPITPMLDQILPNMDLERMRTVRPDALTQAMKRLMPNHHLHELRHTFITRCQECGVAREVVSVWAGHAADNTQTSNVYTHFSPEFMRKEAKKIIYNL